MHYFFILHANVFMLSFISVREQSKIVEKNDLTELFQNFCYKINISQCFFICFQLFRYN
jgi:hypothetical protein